MTSGVGGRRVEFGPSETVAPWKSTRSVPPRWPVARGGDRHPQAAVHDGQRARLAAEGEPVGHDGAFGIDARHRLRPAVGDPDAAGADASATGSSAAPSGDGRRHDAALGIDARHRVGRADSRPTPPRRRRREPRLRRRRRACAGRSSSPGSICASRPRRRLPTRRRRRTPAPTCWRRRGCGARGGCPDRSRRTAPAAGAGDPDVAVEQADVGRAPGRERVDHGVRGGGDQRDGAVLAVGGPDAVAAGGQALWPCPTVTVWRTVCGGGIDPGDAAVPVVRHPDRARRGGDRRRRAVERRPARAASAPRDRSPRRRRREWPRSSRSPSGHTADGDGAGDGDEPQRRSTRHAGDGRPAAAGAGGPASSAARAAATIAAPDSKRSAGSLASARAITASSAAGRSAAPVTHARRRGLQMPVDDRRLVGPGERDLAGEALEQHAAERVQVGGRVRLLAADHLRRHVGDRSHRPARCAVTESGPLVLVSPKSAR